MEIERYKDLADEIQYKSTKVVRIGMFEVHCDELIRALTRRAENLANMLLTRVQQDHQKMNKSICDQYEQFAEKALSIPSNTAELMELKAFVDKFEKTTQLDIENELVEAKNQLKFIVDHAQFSASDLRHNAEPFLWHGRLQSIFETSRSNYEEKRVQYEEQLRYRRERFIEELEGYARQVDEFQILGDLTEISKYLKKAQALDSKLQLAQDKIEQFNGEEEAFAWETTQYPQRSQVMGVLKPYLQLYEMTLEWKGKSKEWSEGPMSGVNPDTVEQEVGNFYRTMFKLEKNFEAVPSAKRIATKVRKIICYDMSFF